MGRACLSVENATKNHPVHFTGRSQIQKWLYLGHVNFAELFRGFGELTIRVREAGCSASDGFDKYAITYERCWCLDAEKTSATVFGYSFTACVLKLSI